MMSPAISVAIINALCLREGCDVKLFETTQYSDEYDNKHIRMSELGAVRGNKDEEIYSETLCSKLIVTDIIFGYQRTEGEEWIHNLEKQFVEIKNKLSKK